MEGPFDCRAKGYEGRKSDGEGDYHGVMGLVGGRLKEKRMDGALEGIEDACGSLDLGGFVGASR